MTSPEQDHNLKRSAALLANLVAEAYVVYDKRDLSQYTYATDIFNRAATSREKEALALAHSARDHAIGDAQVAHAHKDEAAFKEKIGLMDDMLIKKAEIMAKVLIVTQAGAEEDMVKYVKHSTDAKRQDPSALAKVFKAIGAPVLARIAEKAVDAPPCPSIPLSYKIN